MSDETTKETAANNDEDDTTPKQSADEDATNGDQSTPKKPKQFSVDRVTFGPESALPEKDTASSPTENMKSPKSPIGAEQFTFGYATNEAIPMTIFYRSQHSQGHGGKQRPTLQELRKKLEDDKVR